MNLLRLIMSLLYENGYFIAAIRYPTVSKGTARLRGALMSSHTEEELAKCAELIGKALNKTLKIDW